MAGGFEREVNAGESWENGTRAQILQRFENWLDAALTAEQPPEGIDEELLTALKVDESAPESGGERDSYALWSALTVLAQEVKLQGRTFKELNATVEAQAGRIAEEVRSAYRERERELRRDVEQQCRKEALNALIDLRDRM